ncbi:MAG: peptidoglycan DD-metalloendopeptidase family protein [Pseudomonadota bacterium]
MKKVMMLAVLTSASLAANAAQLPFSANDLGIGERFSTGTHGAGIQAMGKDIGARRHVSDNNWPWKKNNAVDGKVLDNHVIYNKPFYAMADGTVVGCWRNAPENVPGSSHPDLVAKRFAGGGNHLWILQNDGSYALYAHATPGSIPKEICPHDAALFSGTQGPYASPDIDPSVKVSNGAKIKAGQMLGRVGNSGSSSGPHLHVHVEKDGKPVPMKFDRGLTRSFGGQTASLSKSWTRVAGNTLPEGDILFWPHRPIGNYTFKGTPGVEYQTFFDHMTDSGMMPDLITCKSSGKTYDTTWSPWKGSWISHHGMSAEQAAAKHKTYVAQGFKRTSSYTCGSVTVAVWKK